MESLHTSYPVHRTFKVAQTGTAARTLEAIKQQLPGIQALELNMTTSKLAVTYDAGVLSFPAILERLTLTGICPTNSWWFRLKSAWYDYTDRNVAELAHKRPKACCNKVPKA